MEISPSSPLYRKAFNNYLRRGIAIETSLKAAIKEERPTTHYIWRTRGDGNVRREHAANNGKIFAWDNPPPTGHPGDDYGCRCTAEPYYSNVNESISQEVISIIDEGLSRWYPSDFIIHYYLGGGRAVRLSHIGQLREIIEIAKTHVFKGVERQVMKHARGVLSGSFNDTFRNSYDFSGVSWIHGHSTVNGNYTGAVVKDGNALHVEVIVEYNFSDTFTDPLNIRESGEAGTSDPRRATAQELEDSEAGGTFYAIFDSWRTRLSATIDAQESISKFRASDGN